MAVAIHIKYSVGQNPHITFYSDRQTDTRRQQRPRLGIASRGKTTCSIVNKQ